MNQVRQQKPKRKSRLIVLAELEATFTRIRRGTLRCDWVEVENAFRRFCEAHDDVVPKWFVDEYVFQAMRLWADGHLGQLLRHFASFVNRAAGAPLVDEVGEAEAIREALFAPPTPTRSRRPPGRVRPVIDEASERASAAENRVPRNPRKKPLPPAQPPRPVDVPQPDTPLSPHASAMVEQATPAAVPGGVAAAEQLGAAAPSPQAGAAKPRRQRPKRSTSGAKAKSKAQPPRAEGRRSRPRGQR